MSLSQNGPLSGHAVFDEESYEAYREGDKGRKEKRPSLVTALNGTGLKIALLDVGAKKNIALELAHRGCDVTVWPAMTRAEDIIASNPDGIMLSNGPGDPKECTSVIREVRKLYDSDIPDTSCLLSRQVLIHTSSNTVTAAATTRSGTFRADAFTFPLRTTATR